MIGEHIRKIRLEKKISLSELAQRTDVSKTYLFNLEKNNQKNPTIDMVIKIAKVLDIDPMLVFNGLTKEEKESTEENTYTPMESFFQLKKYIEELDTKQIEDIKDFINFTLWKRNQK